MSGVNYRGRARLRDQRSTERLSALLDGVADRAEPPVESDSSASTSLTPSDSNGPQHRERVAARTFLSRPAVMVLIVVLLVVCGISALSLLPDGGNSESTVVAAADAEAPSAEPSTSAAAGGTAPPEHAADPVSPADGSGSPMAVHVVGEVKKPAVVHLSPGARVIDAVEAAGGLTEAAVTERVNLAQPVTDGQQVLIPNAKTAADLDGSAQQGAPAPGTQVGDNSAGRPGNKESNNGTGGNSGASGAPSGGLINLNTATAADLEELPRVGPVLAQRMIDFRTEHGPFTAPEQLDEVSGIGPAMLDAMLPLVTV